MAEVESHRRPEIARQRVQAAVRRGVLPHPSTLACVDCGEPACGYDHRDYMKPLDVEPVCRRCNGLRGGAAGAVSNARMQFQTRATFEYCEFDSAGSCLVSVDFDAVDAACIVDAMPRDPDVVHADEEMRRMRRLGKLAQYKAKRRKVLVEQNGTYRPAWLRRAHGDKWVPA